MKLRLMTDLLDVGDDVIGTIAVPGSHRGQDMSWSHEDDRGRKCLRKSNWYLYKYKSSLKAPFPDLASSIIPDNYFDVLGILFSTRIR